MKSGRKLKLMFTALAVATVCAPFCAWGLQTAPTSSPAELVQADLADLARTLNDPQVAREQRDEAAKRLLSRRTPESRKILNDALVDMANGAALSVAKALAEDARPEAAFIDPLFAGLVENRAEARSIEFTRACATALASYKDDPSVLVRLIGIAQNNGRYSDAARRETIGALGKLADKRSAEFLVSLMEGQVEPRIRVAAADALVEMTGMMEYGQNPEQWRAWWAQNARKTDAEFRSDLMPRRSSHYDQARQHLQELVEEIRRRDTTRYRTAPAAQQPEILNSYLHSSRPEIRAIAAGIALEEVNGNKALSTAVRDRLRYMIGDSDPQVRSAVAAALAKINDPASLQPLLTQLAQENDGDVRASLAEALGPINDLQAVPALLKLLSDPSRLAATKASRALASLGPKILAENPELARQTAIALRQALTLRPPNVVGNNDVRAALVDAMAPLRQEQLLQDPLYLMLRRPDESPDIRRRVLNAIGMIRNPQSGPSIANAMQDDEAIVRRSAVIAMGSMPTAVEYAENLFRRIDKTQEKDTSVQDEAWKVFQTVLPAMSIEQLNQYANRLRADPAHQFVVQKTLEDKLRAAQNAGALADLWENMGQTLMDPANNDPRSAAEYIRKALDFRKQIPGIQPAVLDRLRDDLLKALLRSKQYREAVQFASESIKENGATHRPLGGAIKNEADRLKDENDLDSASLLIQEAKAMTPPLESGILNQLADIESQIKRKLQERSGSGSTGYASTDSNAPTTSPTNMASGR